MLFSFLSYNHNRGRKIKGFIFHCMPLALASRRKYGCDGSSFVIKTSFLVDFFSIFIIPHVGYKLSSFNKMYGVSNERSKQEHHKGKILVTHRLGFHCS